MLIKRLLSNGRTLEVEGFDEETGVIRDGGRVVVHSMMMDAARAVAAGDSLPTGASEWIAKLPLGYGGTAQRLIADAGSDDPFVVEGAARNARAAASGYAAAVTAPSHYGASEREAFRQVGDLLWGVAIAAEARANALRTEQGVTGGDPTGGKPWKAANDAAPGADPREAAYRKMMADNANAWMGDAHRGSAPDVVRDGSDPREAAYRKMLADNANAWQR